MLVFTPDLEQVEEVCCRGVDGDEVFGGFWGWGGEVEDFEVFGALGGGVREMGRIDVMDIDGTLTYSLIWMPFIVRVDGSVP